MLVLSVTELVLTLLDDVLSGARPLEQNLEEIERLTRQVRILTRVLRIQDSQLAALLVEADWREEDFPQSLFSSQQPVDVPDSMRDNPLFRLALAAEVSDPSSEGSEQSQSQVQF